MTQPKKGRRCAVVERGACVACGSCIKVCPKSAIEVLGGAFARVDLARCVGCSRCARTCPASVIRMEGVEA